MSQVTPSSWTGVDHVVRLCVGIDSGDVDDVVDDDSVCVDAVSKPTVGLLVEVIVSVCVFIDGVYCVLKTVFG